jgi:hypothetical protein
VCILPWSRVLHCYPGSRRRIFRIGTHKLNHRTPLEGGTIKFAFVINEAQNQLGKLFSLPYVEAKHANAELITRAVKRAAYRALLLLSLTDLV